MAWHVVVAGGGFGGFYAARTLEKVLPAQAARITLVNDVNFMLYTPLLPGAAAGTLEPRHVVVPLREELRETDLRLGTVVGADPARNRVLRTLEAAETLDDPAAREAWLTYVVVGAGYAGTEMLAELQDFAADILDLYPRCRTQGMRWML